MTAIGDPARLDHEVDPEQKVDPEQVALVWMDAEQALVVRWNPWRDEPEVERILSGVPPKRRAVGSVRRGPARPEGGGRVPGHGTEGRHREHMERYMDELARKLAGLHVIEVTGRGQPHEDLVAVLRHQAGEESVLSAGTTSRRPSERQLMARLRTMVDRELPRQSLGRYRLVPEGPTSATGRPTPEAEGRRTLRPAALPEHVEVELEVESMLSDDPTPPGASDR